MAKIKEIAEKLKKQRNYNYTKLTPDETQTLIDYIEEKEKPQCRTCKYLYDRIACSGCDKCDEWEPVEEQPKTEKL